MVSYKSIAISFVVGGIVVFLFAWLTAPLFATAFIPVMAAIGGYIFTGIVEGAVSDDRTVVSPGVSAFLIALLMMWLYPLMNFKGFQNMTTSDHILLAFNGVIFATIGGWVGEMFRFGKIIQKEEQNIEEFVDNKTSLHRQGGLLKESVDMTPIEWRWIFCGIVVGLAQSILISSLHFALFVRETNPAESLLIPFIVGLVFTGFVIGWRSPGHILKEAALSGFLTVVIDMNIVVVGLATVIPVYVMFGGMIIGVVVTLLGAIAGEKLGQPKVATP